MLAFICTVGALVSITIAIHKNRHPIGWLIAGALLPLISVILLLALPAVGQEEGNPAR